MLAFTSNIRWGVVNLQDKFRKAYAGSFTSIRIQGLANNLTFYDPNRTDNIKNIWEDDEIPFSRLQKSAIDNADYEFDETYKFNEFLPCDIRQIDFIKGIIICLIYNLEQTLFKIKYI